MWHRLLFERKKKNVSACRVFFSCLVVRVQYSDTNISIVFLISYSTRAVYALFYCVGEMKKDEARHMSCSMLKAWRICAAVVSSSKRSLEGSFALSLLIALY
jgi:hypothetical protein